MTADASGAAERRCRHCGGTFTARKGWQLYCSPRCRSQHHGLGDGALRGVVSKVSVMRRGVVSVVLRFDLTERERAQALTPGDVLEIMR